MALAPRTIQLLERAIGSPSAIAEILTAFTSHPATLSEHAKHTLRNALTMKGVTGDVLGALNAAHTTLGANDIEALRVMLGDRDAANDIAANLA